MQGSRLGIVKQGRRKREEGRRKREERRLYLSRREGKIE
jgi:hypothetical protein